MNTGKRGRGHTCRQDDFPLRFHRVLVPARQKLNSFRNSGGFLVLGSGALEQNLGGFRAGEYNEVFPIGIWLEISCEGRGPSSRSRVDRSGGSEKTGGIARFLQVGR